MKLAWKALVIVGAILVLIAFSMDTTVNSGYGRVHNIGLQGYQQMLLILGCVVALAGVMVFAVIKLKQTPEQEREEALELAERRAKEKAEQEEWMREVRRSSGWTPPPGSKQIELKGDVTDITRRS